MRPWTPARRSANLNPSILRKGLELTGPPGIRSMAHPAAARRRRLSLVTLTSAPIAQGAATLGRVPRERLDGRREPAR